MNIELDEVVVQDVSDESLEMAAGGAQGGRSWWGGRTCFCGYEHNLRQVLAPAAPVTYNLGV